MKTFSTILLLFLTLSLSAQTPQAIKYQAVARDGAGNVLASKDVTFRISFLQGSISGPTAYSETHSKTTNAFGLVDLEIGFGTPVSGTFPAINWGSNSFFVKIEMDPAGGIAYQLLGTSQLLSVPYALHAKTVETGDNWGDQTVKTDASLWGNGSTGTPLLVADNGITSVKIANGNILADDLGNGSVNNSKILDGTITTADMANDIIVSAKIVDGTVGNADLADNAVTTLKIADANVGTADLANSAVTTEKLGNISVSTEKIQNGSITAEKLAGNAVTETKIATGAVTGAKISQAGATTGQALKWSGTAWAPAKDDTGTDFTLPYLGSTTTSGYIFSLTCNGGFGLKSVAWGPGITGESASPEGIGVLGKGVTGIYGHSGAETGTGVQGYSNSVSGITYGVKGESSSPNGFGVYGVNFSTSGSAIGVYGDTQSSTGIGVYGSTASTGNGKAIYGISNSTGYAGYFLGGQVYIDTKLGIGKGAAYSLDVVGTANLLNGISSGVALRCNGDEAIWYNGTYYSWGYAATLNYFKKPVGIDCFPGDGHMLAVNGVASKPGGGTWTAFSDIRLKDIRGNYERGLNDILRLQPVRFNYKKDNSLHLPSEIEYIGFIAQEVQKIFPESVTENKNGYLEFDMNGVNVAVINAIKELKAENDRLRIENQQLRQNYFQQNTRLEKLEKILSVSASNNE